MKKTIDNDQFIKMQKRLDVWSVFFMVAAGAFLITQIVYLFIEKNNQWYKTFIFVIPVAIFSIVSAVLRAKYKSNSNHAYVGGKPIE